MKENLLKGLKWFYQSFIWLAVLLLAIDIITKQIILHSGLQPNVNDYFDWGFVRINYVLNPNAAFGFGASDPNVSRTIYLIVASIISAALIFYLIWKRKETKLIVRAALIMVVTGAVGNMIDRIFYGPLQGKNGLFSGMVVDWIDFWWVWHYIFNIADSCIVVAAFMLVIYVIISEVKDYQERNKTKVKQVGAPKKVLSKSEQEKLEMEKKQDEESK